MGVARWPFEGSIGEATIKMLRAGHRVADPSERRVLELGQAGSQRIGPPPTGVVAPVAGGTAEIVSSRLDAAPSEARELAWCLSDGERLRAGRFVFERDRRRFVVGRARLRHLLASRLGVQPDAVELDYGPRGKPRLSRRFADSKLRFNVSHSEDFAVYAFSSDREIGVDVEIVRELRDADEIASRFFSLRENQAYQALDSLDKPLGFFNCWTRKEAFIKALGDGLYHPLDRFDVSLAPGESASILRVDDMPGEQCGWTLHSFMPGPGLAGAVVVRQVSRDMPSPVASGRIAACAIARR
jgi:4'-phosphopantetheinyl transferase